MLKELQKEVNEWRAKPDLQPSLDQALLEVTQNKLMINDLNETLTNLQIENQSYRTAEVALENQRQIYLEKLSDITDNQDFDSLRPGHQAVLTMLYTAEEEGDICGTFISRKESSITLNNERNRSIRRFSKSSPTSSSSSTMIKVPSLVELLTMELKGTEEEITTLKNDLKLSKDFSDTMEQNMKQLRIESTAIINNLKVEIGILHTTHQIEIDFIKENLDEMTSQKNEATLLADARLLLVEKIKNEMMLINNKMLSLQSLLSLTTEHLQMLSEDYLFFKKFQVEFQKVQQVSLELLREKEENSALKASIDLLRSELKGKRIMFLLFILLCYTFEFHSFANTCSTTFLFLITYLLN